MKTKYYLPLILLLLISCTGNEESADAYGNFEARELIVSAEIQGKIVQFNVEEGQNLKEQQIVGFIDTVPLALQREQLFAKKIAVSSKIANVRAQIEVQQKQKSILEKEKKRIEQLYKDNAATIQQVDDIKGKFDIVEKQIIATESQISSIRTEMNVIDKQVDLVNEQMKRAKITNPINGTVLETYLEEKEIAIQGKALYKIAQLDEIDLRVYVSGAELPNIKIGDTLKVFVDKDSESNQEYKGKVFWISDQAEFTPKIIQTKEERVNMVYAIKIKVKNDGKLKIGMPGEVIFN